MCICIRIRSLPTKIPTVNIVSRSQGNTRNCIQHNIWVTALLLGGANSFRKTANLPSTKRSTWANKCLLFEVKLGTPPPSSSDPTPTSLPVPIAAPPFADRKGERHPCVEYLRFYPQSSAISSRRSAT